MSIKTDALRVPPLPDVMLEPLVRFLSRRTVLSRKAVSIFLVLLICGLFGGVLFWFGYKIAIEVIALADNWSIIWGEVLAVFHQLTEVTVVAWKTLNYRL